MLSATLSETGWRLGTSRSQVATPNENCAQIKLQAYPKAAPTKVRCGNAYLRRRCDRMRFQPSKRSLTLHTGANDFSSRPHAKSGMATAALASAGVRLRTTSLLPASAPGRKGRLLQPRRRRTPGLLCRRKCRRRGSPEATS